MQQEKNAAANKLAEGIFFSRKIARKKRIYIMTEAKW